MSGRHVICSNSQFWVDYYMQMVHYVYYYCHIYYKDYNNYYHWNNDYFYYWIITCRWSAPVAC